MDDIPADTTVSWSERLEGYTAYFWKRRLELTSVKFPNLIQLPLQTDHPIQPPKYTIREWDFALGKNFFT